MTISYLGGFLMLASLAMEDIREKKISVCKWALFSVAAVVYRLGWGELQPGAFVFCLLPGFALLLLALLLKGSMGTGDGMTVLSLGLWTNGWFAFATVVNAAVLSGIYGLVCLLRSRREPFPFIPFLLLGMEVVLFYAT